MNSKISHFLIAGLFLIASCGNSKIVEDSYFQIIDDPISTGVYATVEGLIKTYTVNSNVPWELLAHSLDTWASILPTKGNGDGSFTVTVAENESLSPRSMSYSVKVNGKVQDKTLEIQQSGTESYLTLEPDEDIEFSCDGGTVNISVISNISDWAFNITGGDNWCKAVRKSNTIALTIDINHLLSPRQATLNVTSPDFPDSNASLIISQLADPSCAVDVIVSFDYSSPVSSNYYSSITHGQYSLDSWGNAAAVASGKAIISSTVKYQVQALHGWGSVSPWLTSTERNPANWSWSTLDRRVDIIRETGAELVITLCGCPTWMYDISWDGKSDWERIEKAPLPENYDDFAYLCAEVAKRYPDVKYFQVWNEMKGFYLSSSNRWDYENYTVMYNKVYNALMAVNPGLKIGGPYVSIDSWNSSSAGGFPSGITGSWGTLDRRALDVISYWLNNKRGGQFIVIDGGNRNKDSGPRSNTSGFVAIDKFLRLYDWVREQPNGGATLPIWWTEFYVNPVPGHDPVDNDAIKVAMQAAALCKCILKGYSHLIMWEPEGDASGVSFPIGLWTSTRVTGGGQPTVLTPVYKYFHDHFSAGAKLFAANYSDSQKVTGLASGEYVLLVNQTNDILRVRYNTVQYVQLTPYEVKLIQQTVQ